MARQTLLIAAAGAPWESEALALVERERDLVLLKRCVDVDDLLAAVAAGQAEVALVGIDAPGLDVDAVARVRDGGVALVAVLPAGEGAADRAARIGVTLTLPETDLGRLSALLTEGATPRKGDSSPPKGHELTVESPHPDAGRVIVVWGPAGAPGRSMLAAALASTLAARGQTVTLIDADPAGGTLGQSLGVIDEVSGLLATARLATGGRLEEHWPTAARALSDKLVVITGLPRAERWREIPVGVLTELVGRAAVEGWVVIDTGASLEGDRDRLSLEAIEMAEELIVIGSAEPVGLTRLARALIDVADHATVPPRVVVNRQRRGLGSTDDELVELLHRASRPLSVHVVPADQHAADRAAVAATSVVDAAPDSALARAIGRIADTVVPLPGGTRRLRRRTGDRAHRR